MNKHSTISYYYGFLPIRNEGKVPIFIVDASVIKVNMATPLDTLGPYDFLPTGSWQGAWGTSCYQQRPAL